MSKRIAGRTDAYAGAKWRCAVAPGPAPDDSSVLTSTGTVSMSVSSPHDAQRPLLGMASKPRGRRPPRRVALLRLCYGPAPSLLPGFKTIRLGSRASPGHRGDG